MTFQQSVQGSFRCRLVAVFCLGMIYFSGTSPVVAQEAALVEAPATTWLLVRHAERDGEADRLTAAGESRAATLAELGRSLGVTAIYSTDFRRTRETAEPLAQSRGLNVNLYDQPSAEWLNEVRTHHRGGVILVVGHSNTVGVLAKSLTGTDQPNLAHDEYDTLYIVSERGETTAWVRLKYGSSIKPPPSNPPANMGPLKK